MKAPAVETLTNTDIQPAEITLQYPWEGGEAAITTPMAEILTGPYWGYRGVMVRASEAWADATGHLWVGRRAHRERPDAGRPRALRPLVLRVEALAPGPNRFSPRVKEVHEVHLRLTCEPETATAADVEQAARAFLAGLTPDPEYLAQKAALAHERAARAAHHAAEHQKDLARAKERIRAAKILLAQQEGQQDPELRMLRCQPRKGEGWAKAWHRALKRWAAAHLGWVAVTEQEARDLLHLEGE